MPKRYFLLLIFIFLSACTTTSGPLYSKPPVAKQDMANYIFFRPLEYEIKKYTYPSVYINGTDRGGLQFGGYMVVPVKSEAQKISIQGNKFTWDFGDIDLPVHTPRAGENYYFQLSLELSGYNSYRAEVRLVDEDDAKRGLQGLRLIGGEE